MWVWHVVRASEVKQATWNTKFLFTHQNALVTLQAYIMYWKLNSPRMKTSIVVVVVVVVIIIIIIIIIIIVVVVVV